MVVAERLARPFGPSLELLVHRPREASDDVPILFLHGAFAGAWCWKENWLPRLAGAGRYAAAVSLRGHGQSEGREDVAWARLADFLADVTFAIQAMPAPPVIVAHSFGGLLAQRLLAQAMSGSPGVKGLVLVSTLPPEGLALIAPWLGVSTWLAAATGTADIRRASAFANKSKRAGDGTWNATVAAAHAALSGDAAFVGLTQALVPLPIMPAWMANVPTLVLHGADDPLIDVATAARTALYHRADYVCLPHSGHYPMLGRHAKEGADALCRWLKTNKL